MAESGSDIGRENSERKGRANSPLDSRVRKSGGLEAFSQIPKIMSIVNGQLSFLQEFRWISAAFISQ
jgi:hypothetical protein